MYGVMVAGCDWKQSSKKEVWKLSTLPNSTHSQCNT